MKITILGSGSFFIDKNHSAPSYLIEFNGKNILLDCGPGTLVQLAKIGFDPLKLDYVFLSHYHNDHTSDLIALMFRPYVLETYYGGKYDKILTIVGPKGVKKFVKDVAEIFHHEVLPNFNKFKYLDLKPKMEFDDFSLETFKVEHSGLDARSMRFLFGDKIIAYSGDAALPDGVANAAKKADLLIVDCATPGHLVSASHLNTSQVGELCRESGVKHVILSHQVPPGYKMDMVGQVKKAFKGKVTLAKDLLKIQL